MECFQHLEIGKGRLNQHRRWKRVVAVRVLQRNSANRMFIYGERGRERKKRIHYKELACLIVEAGESIPATCPAGSRPRRADGAAESIGSLLDNSLTLEQGPMFLFY